MNQNQTNIIIGLLVLILLILIIVLIGGGRHYGGWGMMGWMNGASDEHFDEMLEHMHDDSDHEHEEDDGHFHNMMGEHVHDDEPDDTPTSADDAPPGSLHNLPVPPAVAAVRMTAAEEFNVPGREVLILSAHEETWPNGCLGLAEPDEMCTEALVDGYDVTVEVGGEEYTYRTNNDGSAIRREQ